jgi:hypothetical protein
MMPEPLALVNKEIQSWLRRFFTPGKRLSPICRLDLRPLSGKRRRGNMMDDEGYRSEVAMMRFTLRNESETDFLERACCGI